MRVAVACMVLNRIILGTRMVPDQLKNMKEVENANFCKKSGGVRSTSEMTQ